jgi:NADPH-dependent curcumin reductase CurA
MVGGTVSRVISSRHPGFNDGDLVVGMSGWQRFAVSDGIGLIKLDPNMPQPSLALGVLGMPGFTAYMGLLDIGKPQMGETVVVAAASGAVGSVVGQVARLKGCRVIGIAGGAEKCAYVINELGFDACLDHRAANFPEELVAACHEGIDIYFEGVGGAVFDAVLPLLKTKARVPVCGLISSYNETTLPKGPDRLSLLMRTILTKRLTFKGFIIFDDYGDRFEEFQTQMSEWVRDGKVKFREDIIEGLPNAPAALIGLLEGRNFGKLIVRVASE